MLRFLAVLVALLVAACAQPSGQQSAGGGGDASTPNNRIASNAPRHALVIGNGAYTSVAPLPNPANDARSVASALAAAGYQLHGGGALTDLTAAEMRAAIASFGRTAAETGGIAFVYYAGHGVQLGGVNYLIPTDADIASTDDIRSQAVSAQLLLNTLAEEQVELKVIVLDACRDLPFAEDQDNRSVAVAQNATGGSTLRSLTPGLSQLQAPPGALVAFSTGPGAVAQDGPIGGNSPYAAAMVEAMSRPGLRFEDLFIAVRNIVRAKTQGAQTPWETSSLTRIASFQGEAGELGSGGTVGLSRLTSEWDGRYEGLVRCDRVGGSTGYEQAYWIDVIGGQAEFGYDLGNNRWSRNTLTVTEGGGLSVGGSYGSSLQTTRTGTNDDARTQYEGRMRRGTTTAPGRRGERRCSLSLRYVSSLDAPRPTRAAGLPDEAVRIPGAQLAGAVSEMTFVHASGLDRIYYAANNRGRWRTFNGGSGEDFSWSIDGDLLCDDALQRCKAIYAAGSQYYFVTTDNLLVGRYSRREGEQLIFFAN